MVKIKRVHRWNGGYLEAQGKLISIDIKKFNKEKVTASCSEHVRHVEAYQKEGTDHDHGHVYNWRVVALREYVVCNGF